MKTVADGRPGEREPEQRSPKDPFRALMLLTRRYGDVAQYRGGAEPGYLVNQPDYIKHILADNSSNYSKETFINGMFQRVVADGLLTSENPLWKRQRRLMHPAFHRERLISFGTVMTDATLDMLEGWRAAAGDGRPLDVAAEMGALTLRITASVLFGADIAGDATRLGAAIAGGLRNIISPHKSEFQEGMRQLHEAADDLIEERRRSGMRSNDLLTMLMEARDEDTGRGMSTLQLREEILTLLLAGHETTANALSWTWYLLSENPVAMKALRDQLRAALGGNVPAVSDLPAVPYTRMVLEESMRLYPPAWILGRKALADDELGPHRIPAGSVVAISPYTMHRHPAYWDEPNAFDPLRFSPERTAQRRAFSYIPFGAGPRLCIGHNMAMIEAQLVIATVAQRYDLRVFPGRRVVPERLFVLRPLGGLPMTVRDVA